MKHLTVALSFIVLSACSNPQVVVEPRNETAQQQAAREDANDGASLAALPPIHQAIVDDDEARTRQLLKEGVDVNQLDPRMGNAPLHIAAQCDNLALIKLLLAHGAFVNLHAPRSGSTALMIAAWYSKADNIKELLRAPDINIYARSPHGGATARDYIGGWDDDPDENDLRRNKELVDIFDAYETKLKSKIAGQKLYQIVTDPKLSEVEKEEQIKVLIKAGESPNRESFITGTGDDRHSPLLVAARENYVGIVRLLLEASADIGQRGYMMNAIAFHKAAYMGNPRVLELLVAHEDAAKYIDDQGLNNGYTPLHDAIWHGHTEAAKVLVDAGARLDLRSYEGDTPLGLAKRYQYAAIVELIRQKHPGN